VRVHVLSLLYSLQNPWRRILVKKLEVTLYTYSVSSSHFSNVLLNSPQPNHLSPTILEKFLRILNFLSPSFESLSINSLSVTIAAALYSENATNGGSKLKSMDCVPSVKSSTVLVTVERTETRDVVAMELHFSVTPAIRGTLLPFSNARRRALCQRQHRHTYPQTEMCKGWQLTYYKDPIHRHRGGSRPRSPHSESSGN
jgi:hypothetical protein